MKDVFESFDSLSEKDSKLNNEPLKETTSTEPENKKGGWIKKVLTTFFVLMFVGISVCVGFSIRFNLIYEAYTVIGTSMQPNINPGGDDDKDLVFVNTKAVNSIKPGDIVVIKEQTREGEYIIKRCIATAGQTVTIKKYENANSELEYSIYIDESFIPLQEDYILNAGEPDAIKQTWINFTDNGKKGDSYSITVGEGEIFVLGDNRGVSYDSSSHGPFKLSSVVGRMDFYVKSGTNELNIALLKFKFMFIIK